MAEEPRSRSLSGRLVRGLALIFAALFLPCLALWLYAVLTFSPRLQERLTGLQQRGEPITITEAAPAPLPSRRNAAPDYLSVFQVKFTPGTVPPKGMAGLTEAELREVTEFREHPTPAGLAQVRPLLARPSVQAALATLKAGSLKPECIFPIQWEDGFSAVFPHLACFRNAERVVLAQALVSAAGHQPDAAEDWLFVGLRMARHTMQEPTLIAQLVTYALYTLVADTLPAVLTYGALPSGAGDRLQAEMAAPRFNDALRQALLTERAMGLSLFQQAARDPGKLASASGLDTGAALAPTLHILSRSLFARPFWQLQQLQYLSHMDTLMPQTLAPTRDNPAAQALRISGWDLSAILVPAIGRVGRLRDECQARLGMARIALTLNDYRAAHKAYPPALSQLPPPLPQDPFSGKDFAYRQTDGGYLLYSVGANLKDDGGKAAAKPSDARDSGDVVWAD